MAEDVPAPSAPTLPTPNATAPAAQPLPHASALPSPPAPPVPDPTAARLEELRRDLEAAAVASQGERAQQAIDLHAAVHRPMDDGARPPAIQAADDAPAPTLDKARRRLPVIQDEGRIRARTIAPGHMSREERRVADTDYYPADVERPMTRHDCMSMPRPCPFVSCEHHLYLDVNEDSGAIKLNFPHLEVWEMAETCSLDVADRGGITLEEVGEIINVTRERVRQLETRALVKIRKHSPHLAAAPDDIQATYPHSVAEAFG
jgi:hypothetical protein